MVRELTELVNKLTAALEVEQEKIKQLEQENKQLKESLAQFVSK